MHQQITILGCGLCGMLTALALANRSISSTIIEPKSINDERFYNDIRTTALTPLSKEFLDSLGVWTDIASTASPMLDVYVADNKAKEMVHLNNTVIARSVNNEATQKSGFGRLITGLPRRACSAPRNDDNAPPPLGYIVPNSNFKKILLSKINKTPLITIMDRCAVKKMDSYKDYSVLYLSNAREIICDLLIICDGNNSTARERYFSNKIDKDYNQTALTFHIKHEKPHENSALEHFMPHGPFAILPLKDQYRSSIVWTTKTELAPMLIQLQRADFEYLLQQNCGHSLGKVTVNSNIAAYPLKACFTARYFYNKIVLLGDSAHSIHPLAGQGLNQGIKDIECLSRLLVCHPEFISGSLISGFYNKMPHPVQHDITNTLTQYEHERQGDNLAMYMITDSLNNIFSNNIKLLWYLRRLGLQSIDNLSFVKRLLTEYAMGGR